ncbi:EXS family protein [Capsaspora owczarzaki ATCC 30864]|uniref:EXS family protein n=1 Tax=Capsaspora owczarzaki (strain ATCC 30864) TaxID=595528 RepID=A0A0D2WLP8_CAPO3|nr:EXS family protein [Capsaspora owczarzaki ATCC 30864]KJE91535.1 EXS family protein [Capsaspora owczarzaki ATCC 30864]|eukprot:XP_004349413.2 EXS family protein [Capsaspora owczarzaki ATCC 30864]
MSGIADPPSAPVSVMLSTPVFFRAPGVMILFLFLWGINLSVFKALRINYHGALNMVPEDLLEPRQIFQAVGVLGSLLAVCITGYLWSGADAVFIPEAYPVIFYAAALLILLSPFDRFFHRQRMAAWGILRRVFAARVPIAFTEVLVADGLTSLAKAFGDMEVTICIISTVVAVAWSGGDPDHVHTHNLEEDAYNALPGCIHSFFIPIIISVPFVVRLRQCLAARQHYLSIGASSSSTSAASAGYSNPGVVAGTPLVQGHDPATPLSASAFVSVSPLASLTAAPSGPAAAAASHRIAFDAIPLFGPWLNSLPHDAAVQTLNATKYLSALPVIWLSAMKRNYPGSEWLPFYRMLWLLAVSINSLYGFVWDIRMDWGLLQSSAANGPLLRPHTLYPAGAYYAALALNLALRVTWSLKLSSHLHLTGEWYIFMFEMLEVFRRFIWIFFRVEWECVRRGDGIATVRKPSLKADLDDAQK